MVLVQGNVRLLEGEATAVHRSIRLPEEEAQADRSYPTMTNCSVDDPLGDSVAGVEYRQKFRVTKVWTVAPHRILRLVPYV